MLTERYWWRKNCRRLRRRRSNCDGATNDANGDSNRTNDDDDGGDADFPTRIKSSGQMWDPWPMSVSNGHFLHHLHLRRLLHCTFSVSCRRWNFAVMNRCWPIPSAANYYQVPIWTTTSKTPSCEKKESPGWMADEIFVDQFRIVTNRFNRPEIQAGWK